jgi:uncharacterized membrane protein YdjX (TVP38/TMEM64 family)
LGRRAIRRRSEVSNPKSERSGIKWTAVTIVLLAIVIVPFVLFGGQIDAWTSAFIKGPRRHPGVVSLVLGGLLGSDILFPVPSSIVSTACGLLLGFVRGTLTSLAGMIVSCGIGYALAAGLGRPFVNRMVGDDSMHHFEDLDKRFGSWAIILARPVPVLAEVSVLFAGLGRMPFGRFFLLTTLSNLGISTVYAAIGAYAADLNAFLLAVAGSVLLPGIGMLVLRSRSVHNQL